MSGPIPGTSAKRPPSEIARIARIAHLLDQSMAQAVAVHFGVSHRAATQLITRARKYGHDIPLQTGWNGGVYAQPDNPIRATCPSPGAYKRHLQNGEQPCGACRRDHADRAAKRRREGSERPDFEPRDYVQPPRYTIRLMCDCGAVFGGVPEITRHTVAAHGRAPSKQERTPT